MPAKRIFFLLLMSLWVTEPFLSSAALKTSQVHHICQTCGMEDMCGDVCCCVEAKTLCGHLTGLYPAGCTPDSARQLFFSPSATKFMPSSPTALFRADLIQPVLIGFIFRPNPPSDIFTPPPKMDYFVS
jgi:hypothetical protein